MAMAAEELTGEYLDSLERSVDSAEKAIGSESDLEMLRRDWLGKEGTLKELFKKLRDVPAEQKPAVAGRLNTLRERLETFVRVKGEEFGAKGRAESMEREFIDLSLPALFPGFGVPHPLTRVERRIAEVLRPFGFQAVYGPEIETEYYCFDSLNIPKHHPARDMQDTFYTATNHVLRTHTTSVQARILEKGELPVKIASFGRVYRNETEDASHTAMFHQFDLVWLDKGLTLSNLMALITHILKELYGKKTKVRFVAKFYPYTEPSIGPQIDCAMCKGAGCSFCGGSGWLTVAGAGMIHRNVLKEFKYNPDEVSGFAFGLGTGRMACQAFGLPHSKMLYDGDLRVLGGLV
jgi:phenylalanyl-tRNA synthetase alpha chain